MVSSHLDFLTLDIVKKPRSLTGELLYEGELPFEDVPRAKRVLHVVKGKTEAELRANARAWLDKRLLGRILLGCPQCGDGQNVEQSYVDGRPYRYQVHCGTCGVVLHRGPAPGVESAPISPAKSAMRVTVKPDPSAPRRKR